MRSCVCADEHNDRVSARGGLGTGFGRRGCATHRQPPQRALLALAERDPVLDPGRLERVEQVLRLKGEVGLQNQHARRVRKDWNFSDRANVPDEQPVRVAHVARVERLDAQHLRARQGRGGTR